MHLCRFLRWKTGYGELYRDVDELAAILARNEVPFACLRTQQPWGPDESAALPEQCAPGRPCYEESPVLAQLPRHAAEEDLIG